MRIRQAEDLLGRATVDVFPNATSTAHVVGETPEQVAAIDAMDGAHLIQIAERLL